MALTPRLWDFSCPAPFLRTWEPPTVAGREAIPVFIAVGDENSRQDLAYFFKFMGESSRTGSVEVR